MQRMKKRIAVLAAGLTVALMLTGCATNNGSKTAKTSNTSATAVKKTALPSNRTIKNSIMDNKDLQMFYTTLSTDELLGKDTAVYYVYLIQNGKMAALYYPENDKAYPGLYQHMVTFGDIAKLKTPSKILARLKKSYIDTGLTKPNYGSVTWYKKPLKYFIFTDRSGNKTAKSGIEYTVGGETNRLTFQMPAQTTQIYDTYFAGYATTDRYFYTIVPNKHTYYVMDKPNEKGFTVDPKG